MDLRPYQAECIDRILDEFAGHRSTLAILATGLGKTVIGSGLAARWFQLWPGQRILWLAHRDELITQAAESLMAITGERVAVEMGEAFSDEGGFRPAPLVVSSVQTLSRPRRRSRFDPRQFGLIVTDEAHHAVARSYRVIYHYFREGDLAGGRPGNPEIRHLGITATPRRADDLAMGQVYDTVVYEYGIEQASADGWLCPVRQAVAVVEGIDYKVLKTVAGDFEQGQLEAMMSQPPLVHKIVVASLDVIGDRQALVFCVGVQQAAVTAACFNGFRPGSAAVVGGKTPREERRALIQEYKAGRIQLLCNCGVFLEGFDAPVTSVVIMARPTRSLPLYVQMLGRATRVLPGVLDGRLDAADRRAAIARSSKPFATVLDFVGNADEHGEVATVNAADALGGKYSPEVRDYAKKRLTEQDTEAPPAAVEEVLQHAEEDIALLREEEARCRQLEATARYRLREVGTTGSQFEHQAPKDEPATGRQLWKLRQLGVPFRQTLGLSRRTARKMIGDILAAQHRGEQCTTN